MHILHIKTLNQYNYIYLKILIHYYRENKKRIKKQEEKINLSNNTQIKEKLNSSCLDEKKIENLYLDYQERIVKIEKLRKTVDEVRITYITNKKYYNSL